MEHLQQVVAQIETLMGIPPEVRREVQNDLER